MTAVEPGQLRYLDRSPQGDYSGNSPHVYLVVAVESDTWGVARTLYLTPARMGLCTHHTGWLKRNTVVVSP